MTSFKMPPLIIFAVAAVLAGIAFGVQVITMLATQHYAKTWEGECHLSGWTNAQWPVASIECGGVRVYQRVGELEYAVLTHEDYALNCTRYESDVFHDASWSCDVDHHPKHAGILQYGGMVTVTPLGGK